MPKTMAFAAMYNGPSMNPNAPARSAKMRGKRKQEEISMKARNISSSGKVMRRFQIQMRKNISAYPKVISASLDVGVTSFIVHWLAKALDEPSQMRRGLQGLLPFLVRMLCGT